MSTASHMTDADHHAPGSSDAERSRSASVTAYVLLALSASSFVSYLLHSESLRAFCRELSRLLGKL